MRLLLSGNLVKTMPGSKVVICTRNLSFSFALCNKNKAITDYGLNKAERRHLKKRLSQVQSSLNRKHIYKTSFHIDSKYELVKNLKCNEVYNEGGLIALIKPFGVRRYKLKESDERKTVTQTLNSAGHVINSSIEEVLPMLKHDYQMQNLEVIFCPERWTSGILLLSATSGVTSKVKKCFRRSLGLQQPHQTYWALVQGLTVPETVAEKVGIRHNYVQNIGKIPVITKSFSKAEISRRDVKINVVEHTILAHHKENDASLVEVNILNDTSHFLRVWLAHCCSPVLGDLLYGGRVKKVLGKRILVNPNNLSSYHPPEMSKEFLAKLYLSPSQVETIPIHIHQSKIKLAHYEKGKEDLVITASPPEHFLWTCKQFSLMIDDDDPPVSDSEVEDYENLEVNS